MFCADIKSGKDIFDMHGIDGDAGCMVVVRPDQYIAQVLPIDGYEKLAKYFDGFKLPPPECDVCRIKRAATT
jgi:phenol 2-monooxygenase